MEAKKTHPAFDLREPDQKMASEALWARCSLVGKGVKFIKELALSPLRESLRDRMLSKGRLDRARQGRPLTRACAERDRASPTILNPSREGRAAGW